MTAARPTPQPSPTTATGPAAGWLVLIGAAVLLGSQGSFGDNPSGDVAAQQAVGLSIIGGLAGLRLALAPESRVAAVPALAAGVLSILIAVLVDVPLAAEIFAAGAGGVMILGAALAFGGGSRT